MLLAARFMTHAIDGASKTWLPPLGPCLLSADNVKRPRTRERVAQD